MRNYYPLFLFERRIEKKDKNTVMNKFAGDVTSVLILHFLFVRANEHLSNNVSERMDKAKIWLYFMWA